MAKEVVASAVAKAVGDLLQPAQERLDALAGLEDRLAALEAYAEEPDPECVVSDDRSDAHAEGGSAAGVEQPGDLERVPVASGQGEEGGDSGRVLGVTDLNASGGLAAATTTAESELEPAPIRPDTTTLLEKQFRRPLRQAQRKTLLTQFPRPDTEVATTPRVS